MNNELTERLNFCDSLIRTICIAYEPSGQRQIETRIAARDNAEPANDGWVCVRLVLKNVRDYCFADSANTTAVVVSNGLHVSTFGDIRAVDFGYLLDPPESLSEQMASRFFATCDAVDWNVEPY